MPAGEAAALATEPVVSSDEREVLRQTVDKCISMYDRLLDRFEIPPAAWLKVQRLYHARAFRDHVDQRKFDQALDLFDSQRLHEVDAADLPRLLDAYLHCLAGLFATKPAAEHAGLRIRVNDLTAFVAQHRHALGHKSLALLGQLSLK